MRYGTKALVVCLAGLSIPVVSCAGLYIAFKRAPSVAPASFQQLIIAHRGGAQDAPENTLGAILQSARSGVTAVEIDAQLSKDHIPVVIHDPTLERTTDGKGEVSGHSLAQLKALRIVRPEGSSFSDERIPTVEEVSRLIVQQNLILEIDVRPEVLDKKEMANRISALFEKYDLYGRAFVSSFHPIFLYQLRSINPKITTALSMRPNATGNFLVDGLLVSDTLIAFLGVAMIEPHKQMVNPGFVEKWRRKNLVINAWTINSAAEKEHFKKFMIAITTNCPLGSCSDLPSDML